MSWGNKCGIEYDFYLRIEMGNLTEYAEGHKQPL